MPVLQIDDPTLAYNTYNTPPCLGNHVSHAAWYSPVTAWHELLLNECMGQICRIGQDCAHAGDIHELINVA